MAGRPTGYNEDIQTKADEYVCGGYMEAGDVVPSVAGLVCELNVARSSVYLWAEKHKEFSDTLDKLKQTQERVLLSGSLSGQHNAAIAKLLLHNHGYSDKQSQEISGPNGGAIDSKLTINFRPVGRRHGDD